MSGSHQLNQPMPMQDALIHTLMFIRRRWKMITCCALFGFAMALFIIERTVPLYKSSALLMIERPRASPLEDEQAGASRDQSAYLDGQIFVFYAGDILTEVRRTAGLMDDPEFLPSPPGLIKQASYSLGASEPNLTQLQIEAIALRKLRETLSIRREGDSNVVSISISTSSPQKSALIANKFVETYIAQRQTQQLEQASQVARWVEDRAIKIKQQLSDAEEAVAVFRAENGLIEGERGGTVSDQQLFELNAELVRIRGELAARRAAFDRATSLVDTDGDIQTLPEVQDSQIVMALRTELLGLERRMSDLIQQSGENDRRVGPIREQIAGMNRQIDQEVRRIIAALGNETSTLVAREVLLTNSLLEAGGQSGEDGRASVTLRELERVAESYRELYQPYLANISLAQEGGSLLASGTDIIGKALAPIDPSYPPKKVIVLLLTLLGASFGALIGILREWLHQGFVTPSQVEITLNLPVLNCLPKLGRKEKVIETIQDRPFSPYSEAIQIVRNGLLKNAKRSNCPVVLVTSAGTGDGKTTISTALAASVHSTGKNVLLVDADFRRAGLSRLFDVAEEVGLSDILLPPAQSYDMAPEPGSIELDVMPVGTARMKSAQLLNGQGIENFLKNARKNYDLIIIDGPPVANIADAGILAQLSDAVAFVVRWQTTSRVAAQEALRRLPEGKISGVVLNAADPETMAYYGAVYDRYVPVLHNNNAA